MARAVMEGAAYELRLALEPIQQAEISIERMWMIGGATSSPLWPSIVANVTGLPIALPEGKHWPAVGAAVLAGLGVGAFETLATGQARFQRPARPVHPDRARTQRHDESFAAYRRFANLLAENREV
jgi:sugar (pentulose or hexulose) kinase